MMSLLRNKVIQDESNRNHLFFWGGWIFQVYRRKLWMSFCEDTGPIQEEISRLARTFCQPHLPAEPWCSYQGCRDRPSTAVWKGKAAHMNVL